MANTAQAKKRARQAESRRILNAGQRSNLRTFIKKVYAAAESGDQEKAQSAFQTVVPIIDSAVNKTGIGQAVFAWETRPGSRQPTQGDAAAMKTILTDMLEVEHPVMLAGMGGVSYNRVVAAVSEACPSMRSEVTSN